MRSKHDQFQRVGENLLRHNKSGTYYGLVKVKGKQIRQSLKTRDPQLAREELKEFKAAALGLDTSSSSKEKLSFEQLASEWLDRQKGNLSLNAWIRRKVSVAAIMDSKWKDKLAAKVTTDDVDEWLSKRCQKVAPRTSNKDLEALKMIFEFGRKIKKRLLYNPAAELERRTPSKALPDTPTKAQFSLLVETLRATNTAAADLTEFLGYSGCRLGGALTLRWRDIHWDRSVLRVCEKFSKERDVPLFPPLLSLLQKLTLSSHKKEDFVFHFRGERGCLHAIHDACKAAGLPRFGHHSMRHFFCSNAIEAGIDAKVIAGWLGHSDGGVLVLATYGHLRKDHADEMAKRMTFSASS